MENVSRALQMELALDPPSFFSDSKVALYWIKGKERNWKPFVQNRVDQIRKLTVAEDWHFCPGVENPADIPTRGADPTQLTSNSLWLHGPDLLHRDADGDGVLEIPDECKIELKKSKEAHSLLAASQTHSSLLQTGSVPRIDC